MQLHYGVRVQSLYKCRWVHKFNKIINKIKNKQD
nr:MAG TPA: hypothetical protein [Crassvirales sp.]